ncbi:MAG: response regulator transcription factor [Kangiellaceae bacterium]|nr:response regulator transcription factor [Kangiellaceae bacterium]
MNDKITVIAVDDHQIVRQGIESFLSSQSNIEIVASASSGDEAVRQVLEHVPDVVLMDLNLGEGMDGIAATKSIKLNSPNTKVIVLTSYHSDEHIFPAIKSGALSYLIKDIAPEDLAKAVVSAYHGRAVLAPIVAQRIVQDMQTKDEVSKEHHLTNLSVRESEILLLIADGKNNREISEQLCIAIKTVRCHVSNILSKLHLRERTQAAIHAWQKGMINSEL